MITADAEWLDVFSIMVRPEDPGSLQDDYIARTAHEVPEAGTTATAAEAKERVLERYLTGESKAFYGVEDAGGPGAIAGDVLLYLMQMQWAGVAEPSQKKARWLASVYTSGAVHEGSPKVGYSTTAVKDHWRKYKAVAHLWAAYRLIQFEDDPRDADRIHKSIAGNMSRFLGIARAIQEFADDFRPSRDREPDQLLPADAFRIAASVPSANVTPPPLEDWMIESLSEYSNT